MNSRNRRFSRTNVASAWSRYSVTALCPSHMAPTVEKLTT